MKPVAADGGSRARSLDGGRNAEPAIIPLLYRATRALLSVSAVLLRRDMAGDAEPLVSRHENAVR
ncbi:hypothetical protein ACFXKH_18625 [Streptomyces caelestis]|uniref:hypothetical protein n=1 Tax=Streptomyces caelestis TaxID=36816 RepID=UPI00369EE5C3